MNDDTQGRSLHDRATRGETLTLAEQAQLEAWYARQDREEEKMLNRLAVSVSFGTLPNLRHEVDNALAQLRTVTQRLQTLTDENEALRVEIASLSRRLAQQVSSQAA